MVLISRERVDGLRKKCLDQFWPCCGLHGGFLKAANFKLKRSRGFVQGSALWSSQRR